MITDELRALRTRVGPTENPAQLRRAVNPLAVEEIAHQGRRSTGGKWTRPDIVSVELNSYQFVPGKYIDITTFEVKHRDGIDLTAVYEALGHRRSATRSYVLLYIPDGESVKPETLAAIEEAAKSHGIGLIIAKKADDYSEWDERVEASRWDPPPAKLNEFIRKQLSQGTKNLLEAAVK